MNLRTSPKPSENEDGMTRIERRLAVRAQNADDARNAAKGAHKGYIPAEERVAAASQKLDGTNVTQAIAFIGAANQEDRDFLLLAEEAGKARKSVLGAFPPPRRAVRARYEHPEGGLHLRGETPSPANTSGSHNEE